MVSSAPFPLLGNERKKPQDESYRESVLRVMQLVLDDVFKDLIQHFNSLHEKFSENAILFR